MLSGTIDPSLTQGRRVLIDGHKGTIRYIGPVPATTSTSTSTSASTSISTSTSTSTKPTPTYVGIEWDAADRGKNDGTLDGYTYFTLIQHRYDENRSTAASFLHPKRVIEGISTSLTTALTDKYTTSTSTSDMYLIAENEHRSFHVPIEFVGVSQVSQYMSHTEKLKEVVLNGRKIQYAGDDVGKKIPKVAFIASPLPQLRLLNLTNNYIIPWEDVSHDDIKHDIQEYKQDLFHIPISCHTAFPHLTILILNRVPHAWSMTCLLSSHTCLPLLEELYLCHNNMTSLACTIPNMTCDVIFPSLKLLDLSNNNISEWSSLTPLSSLPHLTTLLLNDNPITSITPLSIPSLTSLSLNDCRITSLSSLDHLSSFPSLHQLHLQRNAPLESLFPRSSHLRLYLIGRFLHITTLNRSHVTLRERTDGEKFYVAHVIQEIRTSGKILTREEIQQRYARAWTLEGETLMTAISTTSNNPSTTEGTQLMNRLINITLQHGTNHVIKRVQVTDTVGNTRLAALRAFKLPVAHATQYHLTYKEKESSTSHQPMSDVMKPLSYYGVVAEGIIVLQKRTK